MPASTSDPAPVKVISDLMSHRLHQLATISSLSASMRYERKFGLTLLEWRAIGMLGGYAPLSLKELARRAGLDKSYASRTVSGLIDRGWVVSERNDIDGRGVMLSLTESGHALYRKIFPDAVARNERMLSVLKPAQRRQLIELLTLLGVGARRLLDDERRAAAGGVVEDDETPPRAKAKRGDAAAAASPPLDIDEMRYLVARMNELIGPRPR
jgi:DNA-binding MarR family transcriptional regulator